MKLKDIDKKFWNIALVLWKMFEFAGINVDEVELFSEPNKDWQSDALYFDKYSWTEAQEEEFKNWLYTQLWKDIQLRRSIMSMPIRKKKIIDKFIDQFVFNYGLKITEK